KEEWEKAKKEVGFDTVNLSIMLTDSELNKTLGEFLQEEISDLEGMNVEIKQLPMKQFLSSLKSGDFDIAVTGWGPDYPDPLTYLSTLTSTQLFGTALKYDNKEYFDLLDQAMNKVSTDESWPLYAKAEKVLLDEAQVVGIYQRGNAILQKDYVKDISVLTFGPKYSYKWASVDKADSVLNVTNLSDITSFDNPKIGDATSREVSLNVMEGLTRLDKDMNVTPAMAENWEKSQDGKTWTFKIRKDAKWSNGESVTANDFEYAFKRSLDPKTGAQNTSVFYDIVGAEDYNLAKNTDPSSVGVKALDPSTLQITLTRPVPYFDKLVSHPIFSPQNQKFVEAQGDKFGTSVETTLFNGPFTVTSWKQEDQYTMEKNPNYWDKDSVSLDKIHVKIAKDDNTALNLYNAGAVDRVALGAEQVDKYKDSKELVKEIDANVTFMQINANK
ncbi:ABC transporter substrate-binding protein, partial [Clostridium sp.]|uniref:peptide ABC transporter substrate-binding protein n=1 Tax=Clostridium sp. TaxID=1506 RepID=UPI003F401712